MADIIAELQELRNRNVSTMSDAQRLLQLFALRNNWQDTPNIDKVDHLQEELSEMSKYLRYKTEAEAGQILIERKAEFLDGIGDLFFGFCRLANQLRVNITMILEGDVHLTTMSEAQKAQKLLMTKNGQEDKANVDLIDELREKLIDVSKLLRHKSLEEREQIITKQQVDFSQAMNEVFKGICRLANQLEIDITEAFNMVKGYILDKYDQKSLENKFKK